MAQTIAVEELSIGMFIQLEGGWLSHPFPVSSFRLSTPEQLATVRSLGVKQVRWVPEKSDLQERPAQPTLGAADSAASAGAASQQEPLEGAAADAVAVDAAGSGAVELDPALSVRRQQLERQCQAYTQCEQQHAEAAHALRELLDSVEQDPARAGHTAQALTQAMLNKMLSEDNVGIRLVGAQGDAETAHGLNVGVISVLLGRALGLDDDELLDLGVGALLHDIGKLELPQRCHHLDSSFNASQVQHYRDHVAKGLLQGQRMGLSASALQVLAQHHEQADGKGFPSQLPCDRITLAARVVAIVNRYDNLCNPRTRSQALTPHEAVSTMFAQSRKLFDNEVLTAFIRMMGVYPAGSLVQLTDERFAIVLGANASRPLKPRVLVHDPEVPREQALLLDLTRHPKLGIRRSVLANRLPSAALHYLDPKPRVAYYFEPLQQVHPPEELAA